MTRSISSFDSKFELQTGFELESEIEFEFESEIDEVWDKSVRVSGDSIGWDGIEI